MGPGPLPHQRLLPGRGQVHSELQTSSSRQTGLSGRWGRAVGLPGRAALRRRAAGSWALSRCPVLMAG